MPTIRPYENQVNPAGPTNVQRANAEDFGAGVAREMSQLGNSVERTSDAWQKRREEDERSRLNAESAQAEAALDKEINDQYLAGTLNTDKFKVTLDKTMQTMNATIETKGGQQYFEKLKTNLGSHYLQKSLRAQAEQEGQRTKVDFISSKRTRGDEIYKKPNVATLESKIQLQKQFIDSRVASKSISVLDGEQLMQDSQQHFVDSFVEGTIAQSPYSAEDIIKSGAIDRYIDLTKKDSYIAKAKAGRIHADDENTRQLNQEKKIREENQRITENEFTDKLLAGTLTMNDVKNSKTLDAKGKEHYYEWIRKMTNDKYADIRKGNPLTAHNFRMRILNGEDVDPKEIQSAILRGKNGLSLDDGKSLLALANKGTTAESKADALIERNFIKMANKMLDPFDSNDAASLEKKQAWLISYQADKEKAFKQGKTLRQITDPNSPDYIGKNIKEFHISQSESLKNRADSIPSLENDPNYYYVKKPDGTFGYTTKKGLTKEEMKKKFGYEVIK